jgi:hypothetical protein
VNRGYHVPLDEELAAAKFALLASARGFELATFGVNKPEETPVIVRQQVVN